MVLHHIKCLSSIILMIYSIYLKFFISILLQGEARFKDGSRPPEDVDVFHNISTSKIFDKSYRWQRIIQNDLENIPFAIIIFSSTFTWFYIISEKSIYFNLLMINVIFFGLSRFLHTLSYVYRKQPYRTIFWFSAIVTIFVSIALTISSMIRYYT